MTETAVSDLFGALHARLDDRESADQIVSALLGAPGMAYSDTLTCVDGTIVERMTKGICDNSKRLWLLRDTTAEREAQDDRALHQSAVEEEQARMTELAEQLFIAKAELEQKQAELTRLANTDGMTGLLNRRRFMAMTNEILNDLWERRVEQETSIWVLMFDIDHFKRINDTFGHAAGDDAIRDFAKILGSCIGDRDHAARLGGEEFAVFMMNASIDDAIRLAEAVRLRVADSQTACDGARFRFTVSVGAAAWADSELSIDSAIIRADKALYSAKSYGRNRVVAYETNEDDRMAAQ